MAGNDNYPALRDASLDFCTYKLKTPSAVATIGFYAPDAAGNPGKLIGRSLTMTEWSPTNCRTVFPIKPALILPAHTKFLMLLESNGSPADCWLDMTGVVGSAPGWVMKLKSPAMTSNPADGWVLFDELPACALDATELPVANTYAEWAAKSFTAGDLAKPAISGATADPDGAGLVNLQRYAFGLTARGLVDPPVRQTTVTENGQTYPAVYFGCVSAGTDITYTVEASGDLTTWTAVKSFAATKAGMQTVRDTVPLGGAVRRFLRVKVTLAP